MKRYLLFCFDENAKSFGWQNYYGNFDTIDDAKDFYNKLSIYMDYQIVDTKHEEIVDKSKRY